MGDSLCHRRDMMNTNWTQWMNSDWRQLTISHSLSDWKFPKHWRRELKWKGRNSLSLKEIKNLLKERNNWIAPYFTPTTWGQFFYSTLWIRTPVVRDSVIFLWFVTLETKTQSSETNSSTFPKVLYCIFLPTISIIV